MSDKGNQKSKIKQEYGILKKALMYRFTTFTRNKIYKADKMQIIKHALKLNALKFKSI
jgi:hypothetical protein